MSLKYIFSILVYLSLLNSGMAAQEVIEFAKGVPIEELNKKILKIVQAEIDPNISNIEGFWTVADLGNPNYIIDGYFILPNGKIVFLDFFYDNLYKEYYPIRNDKYFTPNHMSRLLLEAYEVCNPNKRDFIGVIDLLLNEDAKIGNLFDFLQARFVRPPFISISTYYEPISWKGFTIIDHYDFEEKTPLFSFHEASLIDELNSLSFVDRAQRKKSGRWTDSNHIYISINCPGTEPYARIYPEESYQ